MDFLSKSNRTGRRTSLKNRRRKPSELFDDVGDKLHDLYVRKLLPAEGFYSFREFHSPPLDMAYFESKPMVLLLGEYSVGKTSFIKYLLERPFPAMHIGPEPTTDKFHIVTHGDFDKVIPGNALVVDPTKPFRHLDQFGSSFLNRLQCSTVRSDVLKSFTIVDTPGVLANVDRGYDYVEVLKWFAEKSDLIVLLCDPLKLDISDELKRCLDRISHCEDRIRIVFNKADQIDFQNLFRTYGALMWNLGLVMHQPETPRVFVGTFWDHSFFYDENRRLFEDEKNDLYDELANLPKQSLINKLDSFLERVKSVFIHILIVSRIKEQVKSVYIGKSYKRQEVVNNLDKVYAFIKEKYMVTDSDFPDLEVFQSRLANQDLKKFHSVKNSLLDPVLQLWKEDLPAIMKELNEQGLTMKERDKVKGGIFDNLDELDLTPFGARPERALDVTIFEGAWPPLEIKNRKAREFQERATSSGKMTGSQARKSLERTKLPQSTLRRIWTLSDVDVDGMLDEDEFALAHYLAEQCIKGIPLPDSLPAHLFPPKYNDLYSPDISLDALDTSSSSSAGFPFDSSSSLKRRAPKSPFDRSSRSHSIDSGIFYDTDAIPDGAVREAERLSRRRTVNSTAEGRMAASSTGYFGASSSYSMVGTMTTPRASATSDSGIDTPTTSSTPEVTSTMEDDDMAETKISMCARPASLQLPMQEQVVDNSLTPDNGDTKSLHSSSSRALDSIAEEDEEEEEEEMRMQEERRKEEEKRMRIQAMETDKNMVAREE